MGKSEKSAYFSHTFFCAFFQNFFNGFEISVKFCIFGTHIEFLNEKFFLLLLALYLNFDSNAHKTAQKNGTFFMDVS
jgi:hypothetical protein